VPLPRGKLVDISPVLVFSKEEYNKVEDGLLGSYTFGWKSVGDDGKVVRKGEMALALGMGECLLLSSLCFAVIFPLCSAVYLWLRLCL
jgi:hypothetical protein